MSPWLLNAYVDTVMKEVKMRMRRRGESWLPGLLYADDLVLCGELEEDLRVMVGSIVGLSEKRSESQCS